MNEYLYVQGEPEIRKLWNNICMYRENQKLENEYLYVQGEPEIRKLWNNIVPE